MNIKAQIGCWLNERWVTEKVLARWLPDKYRGSWLDLCNRNEKILPGSEADARACAWENSSYLTVAKVFPYVGGRLFANCARQFPFRLEKSNTDRRPERIRLSVVIPLGGLNRLEQLLCVLESFYAQDTDGFEIILTGENPSQVVRGCEFPKFVKFVECENYAGSFYKSHYLNKGVDTSSSQYILLHDADIVVPVSYVRMILAKLDNGWDAVHPIRLLFYFEKRASENYLATNGTAHPIKITEIRANFAGGSIALRREAYYRLGGMNEDFSEWGLEDVEFYQRVKTCNFFQGRFAPAIHLWHEAIRKLYNNPNTILLKHMSKISVNERIRFLKSNYTNR